ncbi:MAG: hypothetical protein R3F59_16715 [Myxococcota bacterium]
MRPVFLFPALLFAACTAPADPDAPDLGTAPTADARDWAAAVTAGVDPQRADEARQRFTQAVVRRAAEAGYTLDDARGLQLLADAGDEPPPPGGVGYGFWYGDTEFAWTAETVLIQGLVAPRKPGGDVTTWLYNTATNRSNLGVESFVSYYGQDDFSFKVFDWARYPADPWQIELPYADLDEYLDVVASPDGVMRQELKLANRTALVAAPTDWVNEVYLRNFARGTWDLVYSYAYTTATAADNTFEPGDFYGSWAPIFETFQNHDGSNLPIGSRGSWLVQDGTRRRLTAANTVRQIDDPDLDPPVFEHASYGFAVGDPSGEPAVTALEAEDGAHTMGHALGVGWAADPADGAGTLVSRSAVLPGGRVVAAFELAVPAPAALGVAVGAVEVWDDTTGTLVGSVSVLDSDFHRPQALRPFRIELDSVAGHDYRFEVQVDGVQTVMVDRVGLASI